MAAAWQSLVSQKLFLATRLAQLSCEQSQANDREACLQGAVQLAVNARQLVLVLITQYYQQPQANPGSLEDLASLLPEAAETDMLTGLSRQSDSWWTHLEHLQRDMNHPPKQRKTVSGDNIIAIAAEPGTDKSAETLLKTLTAMKAFVTELGSRHAEW